MLLTIVILPGISRNFYLRLILFSSSTAEEKWLQNLFFVDPMFSQDKDTSADLVNMAEFGLNLEFDLYEKQQISDAAVETAFAPPYTYLN